MQTNLTRFSEELAALLKEGTRLKISLAVDVYGITDELKERIDVDKLPVFKDRYERWYSLSMQVVRQVLPDRLPDFVKLYRDEKRKEIDFLTYGISDYMIGLETSRGGRTIADGKSAFPKFEQQLNILESAEARLESVLFDMIEVVQADLFDDELDSARELNKKGFLRAAGAIAGVVIEKHLAHVCAKHNIKTRKKHPTINDLNQMLKDGAVIDTPMWRQIQYLGDIRNLCDHNKDREPTSEEVKDLIEGVGKLVRTLF